jgi:hypothetical protein
MSIKIADLRHSLEPSELLTWALREAQTVYTAGRHPGATSNRPRCRVNPS